MEQYSNTEVANLGATDGDTSTDDNQVNVEPKPELFAEIAHKEKEQFRQKQQTPPAARTLEQTRAELKELAPIVRGLLHEVELLDTNVWANGPDERQGYRAQGPVVIAHFAILALELVEADQGATV